MIISQISPVNTIQKTRSNVSCQKTENAQISVAQNGLTFAQTGALKASKLPFKGRIIAPSYDVADVKIVQDLLEKCRYGKKDLIYGDISKVKTVFTDEGVAIENFYTPDNASDEQIYGICEELSYKVGRRLQTAFGDKHLVFAIDDGNKKFHQHVYLGMLPNTPENIELVDKQVGNFDKMHKLYESTGSGLYKTFRTKLKQSIETGTKLEDMELKEYELFETMEQYKRTIDQLSSNFDVEHLRNALIIDPSCNSIEEHGLGSLFDGYSCHALRSLEQINAVPSHSGKLIPNFSVPLGYLRDLAPEFLNNTNKDSMISMRAFDTGIYPSGCKEFMDSFPKADRNHLLFRFLIKLNEAFKKPQE